MIRRECLGPSYGQRCPSGSLVTGSRCPSCQRVRYRVANARRDPLSRAVYNSHAYQQARAAVLAGATHCAWCHRPASEVGKLTAGHVQSIQDAPHLATDPANLAPSCRSCQERDKHRRKA